MSKPPLYDLEFFRLVDQVQVPKELYLTRRTRLDSCCRRLEIFSTPSASPEMGHLSATQSQTALRSNDSITGGRALSRATVLEQVSFPGPGGEVATGSGLLARAALHYPNKELFPLLLSLFSVVSFPSPVPWSPSLVLSSKLAYSPPSMSVRKIIKR